MPFWSTCPAPGLPKGSLLFYRSPTRLDTRKHFWFKENGHARTFGNLIAERAGVFCNRIFTTREIAGFPDHDRTDILLRNEATKIINKSWSI